MSNTPSPNRDLLTVVGARPQFIKSAAVTRGLGDVGLTQWLVHTGQHADDDMGLDFLSELGVPPPDARLFPSHAGRSERMADMIAGVAEEIQRVKPRAVVVYGDTDSTLAGALAAHHAGALLVHVEAGLRSGDRRMPEEHNRILTDQLADVLCTTGPKASAQLVKEGVEQHRIIEVGDVMLDLALAAKSRMAQAFPVAWPEGDLPVMVVTLHRPSTVDDPVLLEGALSAIERWAQKTGGSVYFPVHPRTRKAMEAAGLKLPVQAIDPGPLGYLDMQSALARGTVVLTDSGGVQKEAWYQGTAAVILRSTTEWRELLEIKASVLFDPAQLAVNSAAGDLVEALIGRPAVPAVDTSGLFGEGRAAATLLHALVDRI